MAALACATLVVVASRPSVARWAGNIQSLATRKGYAIPTGSDIWSFEPRVASAAPPGWTCGEDDSAFYHAGPEGTVRFEKRRLAPGIRFCDSLQTEDTLVPEDLLLPDTQAVEQDTLAPDTAGLGSFVDTLRRTARAGNAGFWRRRLGRGVESEAFGSRADLSRILRSGKRSRELLRLAALALSARPGGQGLETEIVLSYPSDLQDSCESPETALDPYHPCAEILRPMDSLRDAPGAPGREPLDARHASLLESRGGSELPGFDDRIRPSWWKVGTRTGKVGWLDSSALEDRADPGLCLSVGKTRRGFRILSFDVCEN